MNSLLQNFSFNILNIWTHNSRCLWRVKKVYLWAKQLKYSEKHYKYTSASFFSWGAEAKSIVLGTPPINPPHWLVGKNCEGHCRTC